MDRKTNASVGVKLARTACGDANIRYWWQILEFLGAAAFSKAVQCVDLTDGSYVCIKIIKNNKDFFDQVPPAP